MSTAKNILLRDPLHDGMWNYVIDDKPMICWLTVVICTRDYLLFVSGCDIALFIFWVNGDIHLHSQALAQSYRQYTADITPYVSLTYRANFHVSKESALLHAPQEVMPVLSVRHDLVVDETTNGQHVAATTTASYILYIHLLRSFSQSNFARK